MELGHLLTRSRLTHPEVSSEVYHDSSCQLGSSVSLPWVIIIYLFTAIELLPGGSGYFTCKQNMKLVTTRFKSGGLHEKHVVATWRLGNHLSICL